MKVFVAYKEKNRLTKKNHKIENWVVSSVKYEMCVCLAANVSGLRRANNNKNLRIWVLLVGCRIKME